MKFIAIVLAIFVVMFAQNTQQTGINTAQYNFIGTASVIEYSDTGAQVRSSTNNYSSENSMSSSALF